MTTPITLPSALATHTGGLRRHEGQGPTVGAVLDDLVTRFPALGPRLRDEHGAPYPFVNVYLNDDDIRLGDGFATAIRQGDEILIVPAVAGG